MKKITIGTRGSKLALWQANHIKSLIEQSSPDINVEINIIKTKGDKILDVALSKIGDKGLFTKELENALTENEIDLAVHSMKDVPTKLQSGTFISTIIKREETNDAFISNQYNSFSELKSGSRVGTSSLRRKAQLMRARPDLNFIDIRGNVDTRLSKLDNNEYEAIILAYAGIHRLGWDDRVKEKMNFKLSLPAVGQGAIGIQIRENDSFTFETLEKINDPETYFCVNIERVFLKALEGGCQVPIGCQAYFNNEKLTVEGLVASVDGKQYLREKQDFALNLDYLFNTSKEDLKAKEIEIGHKLSDKLIADGAVDIIKNIR